MSHLTTASEPIPLPGLGVAFSVFNIVGGILSIGMLGLSLAVLWFVGVGDSAFAVLIERYAWYHVYMYGLMYGGLLASAIMVAGGIGLLLRTAWGWWLSIVAGWYSLAVPGIGVGIDCWSFVVTLILLGPDPLPQHTVEVYFGSIFSILINLFWAVYGAAMLHALYGSSVRAAVDPTMAAAHPHWRRPTFRPETGNPYQAP